MPARGPISTFGIWSFPFGVAGTASLSVTDEWRGGAVWDSAVEYSRLLDLSYLVDI